MTIVSWKENNNKSRQCVENQRHYSAGNVHRVKAMVFPGVTYGCESWTIKKEECQRIHAFEMWSEYSPLDSKEIKPVNLKGDQP